MLHLLQNPGVEMAVRFLLITLLSVITTLAWIDRAGSELIITKKDNGGEITIDKGDTFRIELEELGSAGFVWEFGDIDPKYIEVLNDESGRVAGEGLKTGAPKIRVWSLRAGKAGETVITMYYCRPWEGKEKVADKFVIRLRVR